MKWLFNSPIAHRGLHTKNVCENSLNAFAQAMEHGYGIELDVQLTQDGKVVVFHDLNTFRLTNKDLEVDKTEYADLKILSLGNNQEHIPLLKEVLDLVQGKVPLLIELKVYEYNGELEKAVSKLLDKYQGEYAVCSFNHQSLKWFKNHSPQIPRGLLFGEERKKISLRDFFNFIYYFDATKPNFISLNKSLLKSKIVRFCTMIKMPMIIWTVNSAQEQKKALKRANAVIFEGFMPSN